MNAEETRRVQPHLTWPQTGAACERMKFLQRIFIRILGVDAFFRFKMETPSEQADVLRTAADQMHFDAATGGVVKRAVPETLRIEFGAEFIAQA